MTAYYGGMLVNMSHALHVRQVFEESSKRYIDSRKRAVGSSHLIDPGVPVKYGYHTGCF